MSEKQFIIPAQKEWTGWAAEQRHQEFLKLREFFTDGIAGFIAHQGTKFLIDNGYLKPPTNEDENGKTLEA